MRSTRVHNELAAGLLNGNVLIRSIGDANYSTNEVLSMNLELIVETDFMLRFKRLFLEA